MTAFDCDRGRAALCLERVNMAIVQGAAVARQGVSVVAGARAPAGMARSAKRLVVLKERTAAGVDTVTPVGHVTAVRAVPRVLAGLDRNDPRRQAAEMLAAAHEQIGAVAGSQIGGGDTSGEKSDGGATTRIKHAERLRMMEAAANLWAVDRRHGTVARGLDLVVMPVRRGGGTRREIRAFPLLIAVCVDGLDLADILRAHGWAVHSKHSRPLGVAVLFLLARIADIVTGGDGGGARRA